MAKTQTTEDMIKNISAGEIQMLKELPTNRRFDWIVRRYGTSDEKKQATRGEYPGWAKQVCKGIKW